MKAIPHTVAATKQARGFSHRCALEIEFDGGTRCYTSDDWDPGLGCPLRDRVMSWGGMSAMLEASDPSVFAQADLSVTIGDPDGELRDLWEDEQFQKRKCALYWAVFVPGEAEPTYEQAVLVLRGILVPPVTWREGDRAITLAITDISQENETLVGARCTRDDFTWISDENEGREVPIIYGHVDRISPILLNRGPLAKVVKGFSVVATQFVVDDAEGFPQGVAGTLLEIGAEVIEGQFDGNVFNVTARGVNFFASTTTNASVGSCTLIDTALAAQAFPDNRFVGYLLKVTVTVDPLSTWNFKHSYTQIEAIAILRAYTYIWGPDQSRQIIRIIKAQNMLEWRTPLVVEQVITPTIDNTAYNIGGAQVTIPTGIGYTIGTNPQVHASGDDVLRYMGDNTALHYAVGMGACTVRQVYIFGKQYKPRTLYLGGVSNYLGSIGALKSALTNWLDRHYTEPRDSWIPLRPDLYSVDTTTAEGRTITRVNLVRYPSQLGDYICPKDDILVDVSGPSGGDGSVIVNPAEVIEDLFASSGGIASVRGCAAWWKMDEESGRVAVDATGNGNQGTLAGQTEFRPDEGKTGGAIDFDDHVNYVLNSDELDPTLAAWVAVFCTSAQDGTQNHLGYDWWRLTEIIAAGAYMAQTFAVNVFSAEQHAISGYVQQGASGDFTVQFRDTTAGTDRARIDFGWVGGDLTILAQDVGTATVEREGGDWKFTIVTTPLTTANAHVVALYTSRDGTGGAGMSTLYSSIQIERGLSASTYISNGASVPWPYVRVSNDAQFRDSCAGQFSVSLWARCEGAALYNGATIPLLNKKLTHSGAEDGFCIYGDYTSGQIVLWGDGNNAAFTANDAIDWTDGEWHHIAVHIDNTAVSIYVDGSAATMSDAAIGGVTANDLDLRVGQITIGTVDMFFNGYMDDARIYDRLLSVAEIEALAGPPRGNSDFSIPRSRLTKWRMNFARSELVPLRAITADLAMQARCRIRWLGDSPELLYQGEGGGEEDLAVDAQHVILNSAVSGRDELEMAVSRVTSGWTEDGKAKSHSVIDAGVEADIGQRERKINCWAYDNIECPRALARWFLSCYKTLHDRANFAVTVHGIGLEPGDIVTIGSDLDEEFAFGTPTKGRVYETTHDPGTEPDALPREDVGMRMFRWAGCDNSCEGSCETTGCETACESYWEPDDTCWTCETSCQTICEHFCETGGQLFCSDHACETAQVVGCMVSCQMATIAGGPPCGACQTTCQCLCTTGACQGSDPFPG